MPLIGPLFTGITTTIGNPGAAPSSGILPSWRLRAASRPFRYLFRFTLTLPLLSSSNLRGATTAATTLCDVGGAGPSGPNRAYPRINGFQHRKGPVAPLRYRFSRAEFRPKRKQIRYCYLRHVAASDAAQATRIKHTDISSTANDRYGN